MIFVSIIGSLCSSLESQHHPDIETGSGTANIKWILGLLLGVVIVCHLFDNNVASDKTILALPAHLEPCWLRLLVMWLSARDFTKGCKYLKVLEVLWGEELIVTLNAFVFSFSLSLIEPFFPRESQPCEDFRLWILWVYSGPYCLTIGQRRCTSVICTLSATNKECTLSTCREELFRKQENEFDSWLWIWI